MHPTEPQKVDERCRWWQPYDIRWIVEHPMFIGFAEEDDLKSYIFTTATIEAPYRENITKFFDKLDFPFTIRKATLINTIVDNEPGKSVYMFYGIVT